MFSPLSRVTAVVCLVAAFALPSTAAAEPITDFAPLLVGDGFIIYGGHTLSFADLAVLAALPDKGLHLGWFKKKLRSGDGGFDGSDLAISPIVGGWTGAGFGSGQNPLTTFPLMPGFPGAAGRPAEPDARRTTFARREWRGVRRTDRNARARLAVAARRRPRRYGRATLAATAQSVSTRRSPQPNVGPSDGWTVLRVHASVRFAWRSIAV